MTLQQRYGGLHREPGISTVVEEFKNEFLWDRWENHELMGERLSGAARDTGNTGNTTILRAGLLLGMVTASNKLKEWNPTGTDGSQYIFGVLRYSINVQNASADQDRFLGPIVVGGGVKADKLIIPGTTAKGIAGNAVEWAIRAQMNGRFFMDDGHKYMLDYQRPLTKATDYTVVNADHGTEFNTDGAAGAVTFSLPATPLAGLEFYFRNTAAQNMIIDGASDIVVAGHTTLDADTITFSTAGDKLGAYVRVRGDGTYWQAANLSDATATIA
jgi:hypothetical protein